MINWLLITVAGIILFNVFDGVRCGFIRKAVSVISLVATLVLVTWFTPLVTGFLTEYTPIQKNLQEKCAQMLYDDDYNEEEKADQVLAIEAMPLPDNVKEMLLENNNYEAYGLLKVSGFYEYVGAYLAKMIINALAYLIAFIMVWTLLKAALAALNIITMLPVLHGINKVAGGILGAAEGVVLVWLLFLLAAIFCDGSFGQWFFEMISESRLLTFLYSKNIIMEVVTGLIF